MKIDEIISKDKIMEYEDFSDLTSMALNDPSQDEMGVQNNNDRYGSSRKPFITLKHIHKLKLIQAAKREELEQRKLLMGLMYGVQDSDEEGM